MREDGINRIEVHVAGICFRKKNGNLQVLIAKRSPDRELYPNLWECGGGQVHPSENFTDSIKRQMKDELGIIIEPITGLCVYEIKTDSFQKKIPGLRFICEIKGYVNGKEPQIDGKELIEWKWLNISEMDKIDIIPDVKLDIKKAAKQIQMRQ